MLRRKLVSLLLLTLLTAATAVAQKKDAPETGLVALRSQSGAERPAPTVHHWLPEPPAWMVWLSGLAVAAVIVVRHSRRSGL